MNAFDKKIGMQEALANLVACIQLQHPGRNATIEDLTVCLQGMGVREKGGK